MKRINLTRGKYALVDDEDFGWLNQWKWYCTNKNSHTFYAARNVRKANGERTTRLMHAEIMKTPKGQETDHLDHNGLNNQKKNLRVCEKFENQKNRRDSTGRNKRSGISGVTWCKRSNRWLAHKRIDNKTKHVGYFSTVEEAESAIKQFR